MVCSRSAPFPELPPTASSLTMLLEGRQKAETGALSASAEGWGLPPLEWQPAGVEKDGAHYHMPKAQRPEVYGALKTMIGDAWRSTGSIPTVVLCREPKSMREAAGLDREMCNCGPRRAVSGSDGHEPERTD